MVGGVGISIIRCFELLEQSAKYAVQFVSVPGHYLSILGPK